MAEARKTAPPDVVATALAARESGYTYREAGKIAGVSQTAAKRYEDGKRPRALSAVDRGLVTAKKHELASKHARAATMALDSLLANNGAAIKAESAYRRSIMSGIHSQRFDDLTDAGSGGPNPAQFMRVMATAAGRALAGQIQEVLAGTLRGEAIEVDYMEVEEAQDTQDTSPEAEAPEADHHQEEVGSQ